MNFRGTCFVGDILERKDENTSDFSKGKKTWGIYKILSYSLVVARTKSLFMGALRF
jgi:hypothetical protein